MVSQFRPAQGHPSSRASTSRGQHATIQGWELEERLGVGRRCQWHLKLVKLGPQPHTSTLSDSSGIKWVPVFPYIYDWLRTYNVLLCKCNTQQWREEKRKWAHFPKFQSFEMLNQQIWEKLEACQSCFCWYCLSSAKKQRIRGLYSPAFGKNKDMGSEFIIILKQRWFRWNTANPCFCYLQKPMPTFRDKLWFKSWF